VTPDGLTEAEVDDRRRRGLGNDLPDTSSRSFGEILRANLFTRFNFLLGGLLAVILVVGPLNDALFGIVLIANVLIGVIQEVRAKRTLDRLSILSAPRARVVREGREREMAVGEVVLDDVLELRPGDQVVVDAEVLVVSGLEVDESLLTGEADPVPKAVGDEVLSGSFVAAGSGYVGATRVGAEAYAVKLAADAKRFTLATSELRSGIDRIIQLISWAMVPTAVLLLISQLRSHEDWREAASGTVAGVVAMVPEGLVLLTSVAFAAGVVRLGRRHALVQELPAVETLARVDVLCLDKTGTITEGDIRFVGLEPVAEVPEQEVNAALVALAGAEANPNATLRAVAASVEPVSPAPPAPEHVVPFSSARKWSGVTVPGGPSWLLGAPEVLAPDAGVDDRVAAHAEKGERVVLLARSSRSLAADALPDDVAPVALIVLADGVRPDAPQTLAYFAEQGVTLKVISGDNPVTVAAVAQQAGLPDAHRTFDARHLPEDEAQLQAVLEEHAVFGRVQPHQKRAMVRALQAAGHTVAMTGDGVNDVLALKDADMGIAMGSGSSASRAAAQLVLLDGSFATLPAVVGEGRRVINNIERVANLFLVKSTYSMLLSLAVGVAHVPFPFLPRHLTLVGSLTIGIPAFFLALPPNDRLARPGFVSRVLHFAVPAGALAAVVTFTAYALARGPLDLELDEARTTAALVLVSVGLVVLVRLAQPLTPWRAALVGSMIGAFALALLTPGGREFFALDLPTPETFVVVAGLVVAFDVGWRMLRIRVTSLRLEDPDDTKPVALEQQ
jgi:cation-transporting P-type ATPase E